MFWGYSGIGIHSIDCNGGFLDLFRFQNDPRPNEQNNQDVHVQ